METASNRRLVVPPEPQMNAKLRKLVEHRLKDQADRLKRTAVSNITTWTEYLRQEGEKLQRADQLAEEQVSQWGEALAKLRAAGFKPETSEWNLNIRVKTTKKRLTALYRAIGRLNPETLCKDIADAEKKLVKVTLNAVQYPSVTVEFLHALKPTDRCRIVTEEVPARVQHSLVCEREN